MTDLTKGIIEIDGLDISKETSPATIEEALSSRIDENAYTKNRKGQGIYFKDVPVCGRRFNLDLFFYLGKLDNIKLVCTSETYPSYEDRFYADCKWLKSVLGEPTEKGTHGIVYKFEFAHIGASWWESDGRSGPDEYISISY